MHFLVGFDYVILFARPSRIPHAQMASTGTYVDQKTGICLASAKCRRNLKEIISLVSCTYLLSVLCGRLPSFHPLDHQEQLTAVRSELQSRYRDHHQHLLTQILAPLSPATCCTILHGQATGAWLTSMPSFYHGTELSAQEFCDALYLPYAESPLISPLTVMAVAIPSLCNMALPALLAVLSLPGTMNYVMSWPTLLPELSLPVLCAMNLLFTLVMHPLL